jgi:hypothetical protein
MNGWDDTQTPEAKKDSSSSGFMSTVLVNCVNILQQGHDCLCNRIYTASYQNQAPTRRVWTSIPGSIQILIGRVCICEALDRIFDIGLFHYSVRSKTTL